MKFPRLAVWILVVVWSVVLLVPPLNLLLRAQVQGSDLIPFSVTPFTQNVPDFWSRAALRHPNEKSVLVQAAKEEPSYEEDDRAISLLFPGTIIQDVEFERIRRLEMLAKKYPDDPVLIVMQLGTLLRKFQPERKGGELEDVSDKENRPRGYVSPERTKQKTNFTPANFQQALALCRQGRKIDPDNAYFDWMECYFLMQSWRDKEALIALEAAAKKPRFEEYDLEVINQRVNAYAVALERPLVAEEKDGVVNLFLQSQYAVYRQLARLLSWEAIKARRRGDHAQAKRIVMAGAKNAHNMAKSAKRMMGPLTGWTIETILWSAFWHDTPVPQALRKDYDRRTQFQLKVLRDYVTAHGWPELTLAAERPYKERKKFNDSFSQYSQEIVSLGVPQRIRGLLYWQMGVIFLLTLISAVGAWGLLTLGNCIPMMRQKLFSCANEPQSTPTAGEVRLGVLGMLLSTILVYLAMIFYIGFYLWQAGQQLEGTFFEIFNFMRLDMPVIALYTTLGNIPKSDAPWRLIICGMPLLFAILHAVKSAIRWQQRQSSVPFKSPLVSKLTNGVLVPIFLLGWASLAINFKTEDEFPWRLLVSAGIVVCAACIFFAQYRRWHSLPQRRAAMGYGWQLLQRSLLVWLVVGSVLYLTIALVSLPMRLQAEVRMDRFLSVGEVKEGKILQ